MPFRKSKVRPKNRKTAKPIKKGFLRTATSYAKMAQRAYNGMKLLKGLINTELKFFDVTQTAQSVSTTPIIVSLNLIAQGTDYLNRVGNSIKASNMHMRYSITSNVLTQSQSLRHILLVDNESDGANPAITDVLEVSSTISPLNHNNGKRFTILKDEFFALNANSVNTAATNYVSVRSVDQYHKTLDYHIRYDNTTGAIGSVKEGNIVAIWLSSSADNQSLDYYSRLRFIDN